MLNCAIRGVAHINERIITAVHMFWGSDGAFPYAGLVPDKSGNLYGTANLGGANNKGTVFKVVAKTMKLTVLHSFSGSDGEYPYSGLTLNSIGTILVGTAYQGGSGGNGVVFSLATKGGTYSALYNFTGATDGGNPIGTMALDAMGNLYGTTGQRRLWLRRGVQGGWEERQGIRAVHLPRWCRRGKSLPRCRPRQQGQPLRHHYSGGANSYGTVFKVATTTETVLHSFDTSNGEYPLCGVLLDSKGNLYGTTEYGGSIGYGVVWEITPQ